MTTGSVIAGSVLLAALSLRADTLRSSLVTFEESLRQHHISLDKSALIQALQNPDGNVRWLAASQLLIVDRALDVIPEVERALSRERVILSKINEASALAQSGDDVGVAALQQICDDRQLEMSVRVQAAGQLLQSGRESCLGTVMEALTFNDPKSNSRAVALSLVSQFKRLADAQSQGLMSLVLSNLTSRDAATRLEASDALAAWGRTSSIPDLQRAVNSETDESIRPQMQADLTALLSFAGHQR